MPPVPEGFRSKFKTMSRDPFLAPFDPTWDKTDLLDAGIERIQLFCKVNGLEVPKVNQVSRDRWHFDVCAYWRPNTKLQRKWGHTGIQLCLPMCQNIAPVEQSRNWSWPGCTVDRTPYGVLAHEVGHLMDWTTGKKKGNYYSEYCEEFQKECNDQPLTSYCPNPAEYFAEMARLYITNPALLKLVRPHACTILQRKFQTVGSDNWLEEVGSIPDRIRVAQERKML